MQAEARQLIKLLEGVVALQDELLRLGERKKQALVAHDLPALDAAVIDEDKTASRLHQVEQDRVRLVAALHRRHLPGEKVIRLENLITAAPAAEGERLAVLRGELRQRATALQSINALNRDLCEQGLASVTYYLDVMTAHALQGHRRYDMFARPTEPVRMNLLDRTA